MDYRIRINPTVFSATPSVNEDMKAAGVIKAHVYIGPINHETNTIIRSNYRDLHKAYGVNKYMMDVDAQGFSMPEDAFVNISVRSFRFQVADLVKSGVLEVKWISATGSAVLTVSGIMAL